jgi:hypothetical protein
LIIWQIFWANFCPKKKTLVRRGNIWGVSKYPHSLSQKISSEEDVWSATSKFLVSLNFFFFWFLFWVKFFDFAEVANVCSKNIFYNGKNFISLIKL